MSEKKKTNPVARTVIRSQTEAILKTWKIQIRNFHSNFEPSDRQLVEWAIEHKPELSKKEIAEIKARFFDDVKELEQIVVKLRRAKAAGEEELVKQLLFSLSVNRKSQRKHTTQDTNIIE